MYHFAYDPHYTSYTTADCLTNTSTLDPPCEAARESLDVGAAITILLGQIGMAALQEDRLGAGNGYDNLVEG